MITISVQDFIANVLPCKKVVLCPIVYMHSLYYCVECTRNI